MASSQWDTVKNELPASVLQHFDNDVSPLGLDRDSWVAWIQMMLLMGNLSGMKNPLINYLPWIDGAPKDQETLTSPKSQIFIRLFFQAYNLKGLFTEFLNR